MMKLTKSTISFWLFVFVFTVPLLFLPGCKTIIPSQGKELYRRDGIQYGVTRGLFLGRWWDFYERGRSYADGKFWPEAESDLREALSIRTRDDRRARTYGAHFIQYFGNRELGVVLFRQAEALYKTGKKLLREGRKKEGDQKLEDGHQKIKSAIEYLQNSTISDELSDDEILTEKAQYYLKQCYRRLAKSLSDNHAPIIRLDSTPAAITNTNQLTLSGWVEDNNHVDFMSINGSSVKLNYHAEQFRFSKTLNLRPGSNRIDLEARDSTGNTSEVLNFTVTVDVDPPAISIVDATSEKITLSIINEDNVRLEKKRLENVDDFGESGTHIFHFAPINPAESVYVEFVDSASNRNGIRLRPKDLKLGKQGLNSDPKCDGIYSTILLASIQLPNDLAASGIRTDASTKLSHVGTGRYCVDSHSSARTISRVSDRRPSSEEILISDGLTHSKRLTQTGSPMRRNKSSKPLQHPADNDTWSPRIEVQELGNLKHVYQEYLIISGRIKGEFENFTINGRTKIQKGKNVRFNFKEKLELNQANVIELDIADANGNRCETCRKTFKITRHPSPEEIREFRATTVVYPPAKDGGDREITQDLIWDLMVELKRNGRFRIAGHDEDIRRAVRNEYKLKQDGWTDASTAARFGKMLNAEYSIACSIRPTQNDVEIYARLIDVQTKKTLASCDVYEYSEDAKDFENAYYRFVEKLGQNFPVVKDEIDHSVQDKTWRDFIGNLNFFSKQSEFFLKIGSDANIKEGMKFVAYNRGEPLVDSETGEILVKGIAKKVGELSAKIVTEELAHLVSINRMKTTSAEYVVSK